MLDGVLAPNFGAAVRARGADSEEPTTILLVESDETKAALAKRLFGQGHRSQTFVVHADTLAAALVSLTTDDTFDAVIVNPDLSDSSGLDTIVLLMQQALDVPVIALCDADNEAVAIESLRYGVQDTLHHETIEQENITRVIQYARERHRLHNDIDSRIRHIDGIRRRFRSVVDDNADAIVVVDADGMVRYANPAACDILNRESDAIIGTPFGLPIEGQAVSEVDIISGEGAPRVADIRTMRTQWDGEPAFVATMRDITDRKAVEHGLKNAELQATEAARLKSEFLAKMSHELRTPLNAIVGFADLLNLGVHGPLGDKRYEQYVGHIKESGSALLNVLNDLLLLAKSEAGRLERNERKIDIGMLASQVVATIMATSDDPADIRCAIPLGSTFLWGDPDHLENALRCVISNAVKYGPAGGKIEIAAQSVAGGGLRITIEDSGPGIPEEDLNAVFEVFGQSKNAYAISGNQGMGLGLTIAKRLVESHEGSIRLSSAVGEGTVVSLVFPSNRVLDADQNRTLMVVRNRA